MKRFDKIYIQGQWYVILAIVAMDMLLATQNGNRRYFDLIENRLYS